MCLASSFVLLANYVSKKELLLHKNCGNIFKDLEKRGGMLQQQQGWSMRLFLLYRDYPNILLLLPSFSPDCLLNVCESTPGLN